MFYNPKLFHSTTDINSKYNVPAPNVYAPNTIDLRSGLTKAISAFSIVRKNCDTACVSALDLKEKINIDIKNQQKVDSCVRRCFVQRLKSHLPEDNQLTDFLYASAFEYNQKDLIYLSLNDISLQPNDKTSKFKDIEHVSKSFNTYFA